MTWSWIWRPQNEWNLQVNSLFCHVQGNESQSTNTPSLLRRDLYKILGNRIGFLWPFAELGSSFWKWHFVCINLPFIFSQQHFVLLFILYIVQYTGPNVPLLTSSSILTSAHSSSRNHGGAKPPLQCCIRGLWLLMGRSNMPAQFRFIWTKKFQDGR